jgi:hypothetical protein
MTIEKVDRYMDFVKFGLEDKVPCNDEPTTEEITFFKSIGAWDEDEDED